MSVQTDDRYPILTKLISDTNELYEQIQNGEFNVDTSSLQTKTDNALTTTDKTVVGAINEVFQSVSSGKTLIATAITDKGIQASSNDTFQVLADKIGQIESVPTETTLTLNYNFSNQLRGYANGTISLLSTDVINDGTYDICWADDNGKLNNYDVITTMIMNGNNSVQTYNFISTNAIPIEATRILAIKDSAIKAIYYIPSTKLINTTKLYSFGALADVHVDGDGVDEAFANSDFVTALNYFTSKGVSATIISGDVTVDGRTNDISKYKEIKTGYDNVYAVRGNHDCYSQCTLTEWTNNIESNGLYYEKNIGGDIFLFMGLNTASSSSYANCFSEEQIIWLETKLEQYRNQRVFVIEHIFINPVGNVANLYPWVNLGGNAITDTSTKFIELMKYYKNVILISGHSHLEFSLQRLGDTANCQQRTDTICHMIHVPSCSKPRANDITTPDTSANTYDRNEASEGYLIDVYDNYIILKGIDFVKNKLLPYAQYILDVTPITIESKPTIPPAEIPQGAIEVFRLLNNGSGFSTWVAYTNPLPTVNNDTTLTFTANSQRIVKTLDLTAYSGKKLYCHTPNLTYSNSTTNLSKLSMYIEDIGFGAIQTDYVNYVTAGEVIDIRNGMNILQTTSGTLKIRVRIQSSSSSTATYPCTLTFEDLIFYVL